MYIQIEKKSCSTERGRKREREREQQNKGHPTSNPLGYDGVILPLPTQGQRYLSLRQGGIVQVSGNLVEDLAVQKFRAGEANIEAFIVRIGSRAT